MCNPVPRLRCKRGRCSSGRPPRFGRSPVSARRQRLPRATRAFLAVASVPSITTVLLSASKAPHWDEAQAALAGPSMTAAQLRDVTDALSTT